MSLVPQSFKNSWPSLETSQLPLAFDPALTMLKSASALPILLLFAVSKHSGLQDSQKEVNYYTFCVLILNSNLHYILAFDCRGMRTGLRMGSMGVGSM